MDGARRGACAIVALVATGCPFDSGGAGAEMGAATLGQSTETTSAGPSDGGPGDSGSADLTTADDDGDDTDGCTPGTLGCPCDDGSCADDLVCNEGSCISATCGNGTTEGPEECDDQNDVEDDGCENDCTISPGAAIVAAGGDHTCVVTYDGRVRCWGEGDLGRTGQLAEIDIGDDELPTAGVDLPFDSRVTAIGLGDGYGCALLSNGSVACWGSNAKGRLGVGNTEPAVLDARGDVLTPLVFDVPVVHLSVGRAHACVVHQGGAVRCWGDSGKGRLGYGNTEVVGDDDTPMDQDPILIGGQAVALATGTEHTCALLDDGKVRCWGAASEGRLGVPTAGDIGDDETPDSLGELLDFDEQDATAIAADGHHTCAIVGDDDELWCWGNGGNGRLGTGVTTDATVPTRIETGGTARHVDTGEAHTCVVLNDVEFRERTLDHAVRCFGEGMGGRLGSAASVDLGGTEATLPAEIPPIDLLGREPRRVLGIAAGTAHSCARTSGGAVRCWGTGDAGRLGYGNTEDIGDDEPPAVAGDVLFE
jgi:cysteine-rich repeat protein